MVTTKDGVDIAVDDSVDDGAAADAPVLVFLHGIAQSRRAFEPLLAAPPSSLQRFRLVASDMRGHGAFARAPLSPEQLDKRALVLDVEAVLEALALSRPILVPWSYGGVVVGACLAAWGDGAVDRVGGVIASAAACKTGRAGKGLYGATMLSHGKAIAGDDDVAYRAACAAFIDGCSARPLPPSQVAMLVAEMQQVPASVRRALLGGADDDTPSWATSNLPVGLVHGAADTVVLPAMSEALQAVRDDAAQRRPGQAPSTSLRLLAGVGHLPWLEAPDVFGEAVAACVDACVHPTLR